MVDDHRLLREAVTELVNSEPGLEVVAAVGDARAAAEAVAQHRPDLVLLDLTLPGGGALGLVQRFHADGRPLTIIVSMHERPEYVRAAIAAGARGYVFKASTHKHLIDAIHQVMAGETYIDAKVAPAFDHEIAIRANLSLSERERVVLVALARGLTYKDIAEQLGVGVRTIETYRRRVVEKLGLRTRADFLRYALELGWVDKS
ncbi:MAG TPA: response regulator transcription factor [Kofleriaceae bacterium]|nr:response regulator transcription factor [Kofleriaceae bacterium]